MSQRSASQFPLDRGPTPLDRGAAPLDRGPTPLDRGPTPLDRGPTISTEPEFAINRWQLITVAYLFATKAQLIGTLPPGYQDSAIHQLSPVNPGQSGVLGSRLAPLPPGRPRL